MPRGAWAQARALVRARVEASSGGTSHAPRHAPCHTPDPFDIRRSVGGDLRHPSLTAASDGPRGHRRSFAIPTVVSMPILFAVTAGGSASSTERGRGAPRRPRPAREKRAPSVRTSRPFHVKHPDEERSSTTANQPRGSRSGSCGAFHVKHSAAVRCSAARCTGPSVCWPERCAEAGGCAEAEQAELPARERRAASVERMAGGGWRRAASESCHARGSAREFRGVGRGLIEETGRTRRVIGARWLHGGRAGPRRPDRETRYRQRTARTISASASPPRHRLDSVMRAGDDGAPCLEQVGLTVIGGLSRECSAVWS